GIFKPDAVAFGCDGAGDSPIEEITIVADQDYGSWEFFHQFLQEIERLHVEVVGGLVENEQVCGAGEQSGEDESGLLATRKFPHRRASLLGLEEKVLHVGDDVALFSVDNNRLTTPIGQEMRQRFVGVEGRAVLIQRCDFQICAETNGDRKSTRLNSSHVK